MARKGDAGEGGDGMMIALHCDRSSEDGNGENLFFEKKSAIMCGRR